MITPRFSIHQDLKSVTVVIYASFSRLSDTEIHINGRDFIFYSSPYYLRLNLPGNLVDSENEAHIVNYDSDHGSFNVCCIKETPGEVFPGLDMLTKLLTKNSLKNKKAMIEVIDGPERNDYEDNYNHDWLIDQEIEEENSIVGYKYGFSNKYSNIFTKPEFCEIIDISDPDHESIAQRKKEHYSNELQLFDEEHYLADLFELEELTNYLQFEPYFSKMQKNSEIEFTSEEQDILLKLPRKEFLIEKSVERFLYLGLVDLIFSYCYNYRINLGEECCESAWNISKISSTLSCLDTFPNIKDVIISCIRRSLVFPLVRNWDLSQAIFSDTIKIFSLGKKMIVKCLLSIHKTFNSSEIYYVFNQIFIDEYATWIQRVKDENILKFAESLKQVSIKKDDLDLDLLPLENAARIVIEEEKVEHSNVQVSQVAKIFSNINIDSDDSESSESSVSSDTSESESSETTDSNSSTEAKKIGL